MRGDRLLRIRIFFSLPPGRRDEKAAGFWEAPRSGGNLFSLLVSLCDLCGLERSAREIMFFSLSPRSHRTVGATNGHEICPENKAPALCRRALVSQIVFFTVS
jgi:hypothetical protein